MDNRIRDYKADQPGLIGLVICTERRYNNETKQHKLSTGE